MPWTFVTLSESLKERVASPEPLNTLIRLFLLGEFISISEAETQFSGGRMGGHQRPGFDSRMIRQTVRNASVLWRFIPWRPFYVSDRWSNPDRTPKPIISRYVYPALTKSTREFLRFLPNDTHGDFLEVCGGKWVAALGCLANRAARLGQR